MRRSWLGEVVTVSIPWRNSRVIRSTVNRACWIAAAFDEVRGSLWIAPTNIVRAPPTTTRPTAAATISSTRVRPCSSRRSPAAAFDTCGIGSASVVGRARLDRGAFDEAVWRVVRRGLRDFDAGQGEAAGAAGGPDFGVRVEVHGLAGDGPAELS